MKKFIKIEWDDENVKASHTKGLTSPRTYWGTRSDQNMSVGE